MDATKKISFGFSKLKQGSQLVRPVEVKKEEVQYVDSFDGAKGKFSFKGTLRIDEEVKKPLVIPLIGTRSAYDVIKNKLDARDGKEDEADTPESGPAETNNAVTIKQEPITDEAEANKGTVSLDALAAKELLQGVKQEQDTEESGSGRVIVPEAKPTFEGEKESTLEDYDNVPVGDYGLALLRGMGWTPKTGIGKDNKVVAPTAAKLRPKRLGLGAEVALVPPGDRPELKQGSLVRVAMGQHRGDVGVVESLEGDSGSAFVRLELSGRLCLSENVFVTITKKEYDEIQRTGGPKLQAAKPEVEKKYGIVFKDDVPKEPIVKAEEKPQLDSSKHSAKQDSRRRERSRTPQRKDKNSSKIESKSRRRDSSSADESLQRHKNSNRIESRSRRRDSSSADESPKGHKNSSKIESKSRRRDSSNDRESSGRHKNSNRIESKSRRRDSSNDNVSPRRHRNSNRIESKSRRRDSSSDDESSRRHKNESKKIRRSRDRSLSKDDSKDRRRKRSKSRDKKKKKSHRRSSSTEEERSKKKNRSNSSSEEEVRKKKKRKKKRHDSD